MEVDVQDLLVIIREAGHFVKNVYDKDTLNKSFESVDDFLMEIQRTIVSLLNQKYSSIPFLSSFNTVLYDERKNWRNYFVITLLDSVFDFENQTGDFTLSLCYVRKGIPFLSVIYNPIAEVFYYTDGKKGYKKYKDALHEIQCVKQHTPLRLVASKFCDKEELENMIGVLSTPFEKVTINSQFRFCLVAEGAADLVCHFGDLTDFDVIASDALLRASGGNMESYDTEEQLCYNTKDLKLPSFICKSLKLRVE